MFFEDGIPSGASAATVPLAPGVAAVESGVRLQYSRGSGPGGQNVNKVNTRAELWVALSAIRGMRPGALARLAGLAGHRLTASGEIHFASDTQRTQQANRNEVFERLRELIVQAQVEPKRRRKTKPSRGAVQRRLTAKKLRGEVKLKRRRMD